MNRMQKLAADRSKVIRDTRAVVCVSLLPSAPIDADLESFLRRNNLNYALDAYMNAHYVLHSEEQTDLERAR